MNNSFAQHAQFLRIGQELACRAEPGTNDADTQQARVAELDRLYNAICDRGEDLPDIATSMEPLKVKIDGLIDLGKADGRNELKHVLIMKKKHGEKLEEGQLVQFYNLVTGFIEDIKTGRETDYNFNPKTGVRDSRYNHRLFVEIYEPPILHWQRVVKLQAMARGEDV